MQLCAWSQAGVVLKVLVLLLPVTSLNAKAAHTVLAGRQYNGNNNAYNYNNPNNHNNNNGYRDNGINNRRGHLNAADLSDGQFQDNVLYNEADYNAPVRNYAKNGYYDAYNNNNNNVDYPDMTAVASSYASVGSSYAPATKDKESSPALSALALLGFLYFLNLIQDTLQNNNGRRKRSAVDEGEVQDLEENVSRMARSFSYLEDFFVDLPKALGFSERSAIDFDGPSEGTRRSGLDAIAGFFTSRLSLISSIMSFLKDPRPSRVRRDIQSNEVDGDESVDITSSLDFLSKRASQFLKELSQDPSEVLWSIFSQTLLAEDYREEEPKNDFSTTTSETEKDPDSSPSPSENDEDGNGQNTKARPKRFTYGMNSWYEEMEGRIYDPDRPKPVGGLMKQLLKLLGGDEDLRRGVASEALPLFEEMSLGLDGAAHPHCMQRALCRVSHLASGMSGLPRISLRLISNNLAELATTEDLVKQNRKAIVSGSRGEDCNAVFVGCDRNGEDNASSSP
ncbi:uncharacterized protein LOC143017729 [Oratosquilla oratoria]|uniref:uncharacterized protein LOC143017729 n=1 Tax=Oratosquilla oratoria TaxID=337810 RepID=UPI003F76B2F8